jgi:hypothetical protein
MSRRFRSFLRSAGVRADPQVLAPLRSMLPFNPGRFAPTSSRGLGRGGAASNRRLSPSVRRRAPFPLSTDPAGRPLPQALPPASVAENPSPQSRSTLVVLHHLDGFLRPEVAGLLHPAASHEVRRVSCRSTFRSGAAEAALFRRAEAFPAALFTPFEELAPPAAVPRRRGRCPLAVRRLRGFAPLSGP